MLLSVLLRDVRQPKSGCGEILQRHSWGSWNLSERFVFPPVKHALTHITTAGFYCCWCPVMKLEKYHLTEACLSPTSASWLSLWTAIFLSGNTENIHPSLHCYGLDSRNRRWSNWRIAQTSQTQFHISVIPNGYGSGNGDLKMFSIPKNKLRKCYVQVPSQFAAPQPSAIICV